MISGLLGFKLSQSQAYTDDGSRIPITKIQAGPCIVLQIKTTDKDNYTAIQIGIGNIKSKNTSKQMIGHMAKAGIGKENLPRFLREIQLSKNDEATIREKIKLGMEIKVADVFTLGDKVRVIGISKGKGFAGVVKRHHFRGGPRTHGQSDRERAPGAIGQTTTPGRVYKGKRMAGRMGVDQVTIKNLQVVGLDAEANILLVKGLIPGALGRVVTIIKE